MRKAELNRLLRKHTLFIKSNGVKGELLNLSGRYLPNADFAGYDLTGADFFNSNLTGANFKGCILDKVNFRRANLKLSSLRASICNGTLFDGYTLFGGVSFEGADFRNVDFTSTFLFNLGIQYHNARFFNCLFTSSQRAKFSIVPETGAFEGWKKCCHGDLVHLRIPADAKRSNAPDGRKCRASKAKVLGIYSHNGSSKLMTYSRYESDFKYQIGKLVKPRRKFEDDWTQECASGIHFFLTQEEAKAYSQ
jgi:hypothetical protein